MSHHHKHDILNPIDYIKDKLHKHPNDPYNNPDPSLNQAAAGSQDPYVGGNQPYSGSEFNQNYTNQNPYMNVDPNEPYSGSNISQDPNNLS
jgi:hypothetical protein